MKLDKAIRLMSEDYLDYAEFLGDSRPFYKERVSSLLDYVTWRVDGGCPDVEGYERKAAKAIRKYAEEAARNAIERLIPVDGGPF
jgi:hypothetical protein